MADKTKIEWCDATANVVNGCSLASPGCTNCYAMRLAGTRMKHHPTRAGLTQDSKAGPVWTGEVRFHEPALQQVLRWKAPRRIFWNAHGDLFHENVPDEWIDRCFAAMALTPQHTHQVLTKRSARMREYFNSKTSASGAGAVADQIKALGGGPAQQLAFMDRMAEHSCLRNAWLGVSVEDQARADERIPDLLATPAAVRWLSCEPLLGPVDLRGYISEAWEGYASTYTDQHGIRRSDLTGNAIDGLDWIVVGGESGPGARYMQPAWAQSIVDQCGAASVPVFVKQLSSGGPRAIKDIEQFPEGLRVQEWPEVSHA